MNQSAAKRILAIIETLAGSQQGLRLVDICSELSLPKSIAHRLLSLLIDQGYVQKIEQSESYFLSLKIAAIGMRYYTGSGFPDLIQPILDRLADKTGELARVALCSQDKLIWMGKSQGSKLGLRYEPSHDHETGNEVVLHATASGKAWLSNLPINYALSLVKEQACIGSITFGPKAANTISEFEKMINNTFKNGYGEANDEGELGTSAIAVPIFIVNLDKKHCIGTLSVAGPTVRFNKDKKKIIINELKASSLELDSININIFKNFNFYEKIIDVNLVA